MHTRKGLEIEPDNEPDNDDSLVYLLATSGNRSPRFSAIILCILKLIRHPDNFSLSFYVRISMETLLY